MRNKNYTLPTYTYLYLTLLCSLSTITIKAQENLLQVDIQTALALHFNENLPARSTLENEISAFGFGAGIMFPLPSKSPIKMGVNFKYMWTGGNTRYMDMVDSDGTDYNLKNKVSGTMSPLHVILRIDPMYYTNFPVMPYIGGFAGVRFFQTKQKLTIDYQNGSEPIIDAINKLSVTSSYGFEIGLHIRASEIVCIDLKYEHAYGGSAKYLDLSSIEIDNDGNATYDRIETTTDVSIYSLGLVVNIENNKE